MLKSDFLMRQIEQLTAAIAHIVAQRQSGDLTAAQAEIDTTVASLTGVSLATVLDSKATAILTLLSTSGQVDWQRASLLARLLAEHGRIKDQSQKPAVAQQSFQKAFLLLDAQDQRAPETVTDPDTAELSWLLGRLDEGPPSQPNGR